MKVKRFYRLRDVIECLDSMMYVIIYQLDTYLSKEEEEEVFRGYILDVPWYMVDYYIANDANGEGISIGKDEDGKPCFCIYVVEDRDRLDVELED